MSSRAQHYREAERLLEALPADKRGRHAGDEGSGADAEEVQVHAMLATVHDDAYSEYVDLKSMEEMRERVAGMPDARSRDWLKTRRRRTMIKTLTAIAIAGAAIASSMPIATAQPGCTASGLSSALGLVASSTGTWLGAHPEAEAAINTADENAIRTYFATHQAEWSELQGIASPLRSLRQSCPQQVSPGDVARLYDAMAS